MAEVMLFIESALGAGRWQQTSSLPSLGLGGYFILLELFPWFSLKCELSEGRDYFAYESNIVFFPIS